MLIQIIISGKKGNSLFAEVDDQRQYMKDLLARQKLHYDQVDIVSPTI